MGAGWISHARSDGLGSETGKFKASLADFVIPVEGAPHKPDLSYFLSFYLSY